jgi:catalase
VLLQEMFRHCKALAAWGSGAQVLDDAAVPAAAPGVLVAAGVDQKFTSRLIASLGLHRTWERTPMITGS